MDLELPVLLQIISYRVRGWNAQCVTALHRRRRRDEGILVLYSFLGIYILVVRSITSLHPLSSERVMISKAALDNIIGD